MIVVDRRERGVRWLSALDHAPEGVAARTLAPLGALYAGAGAALRALRGERALPPHPPSVAVGNLRAGGTGKTPVVHDLGRRLRARGHRVAVLSRGYRAAGGGDEPQWLREAGLEVFLDPDRHRSFDAARAAGASVVLLDDGLQTRARATLRLALVLERDLDRVPRPLPAGPAREGAGGLDRADAFLVRRETHDADALPARWRDRPCVGFRLRPERWIGADDVHRPARGAPPVDGAVVAVSGLARPESFEATLAATGLEVVGCWRAPDHWAPDGDEVAEIGAWAGGLGAAAIVCPEKNLVRLRAADPALPLFALAAEIAWETPDPLARVGIDALVHDERGGTSVPPPA